MKYAVAAILAAVSGVIAHDHLNNGTVTYVTETVSSYTTYCPAPTTLTHGDKTYTITEATTLTITDCPCTVVKPITTTSSVVCHHGCPGNNGTIPAPTVPTPTGVNPEPTVTPPPAVPTAGAAKLASISGVVGLAGLAVLFL